MSINLTPEISVILPVYNGGEYLKLSVQSVLKQHFVNFEFIILDDCSTDGSWEYLQTVHDKRIQLFRNEVNQGLFPNLNKLVSISKAPFIKLWAQDDIMYPHCLETMLQKHLNNPALGFSYSSRDIIDEKGTIKEINFIDNTPAIVSTELHARISFFTGSIAGNIANVCINRTAFEKVGPFNESMKISADFDMWVRLAQFYNTGFINDKLIQLRDHEGQLSRKEDLYINHVIEDMQVFRYLMSYVSPELREEGKGLLRKHKFVFYYTLMAKQFLKGNFKLAIAYYKLLKGMDRFVPLTFSFLKGKIKKPLKPAFLNG